MKRLLIEYNGIIIFDEGVDDFSWSENTSGVAVSGKRVRAAQPRGGGLASLLGQPRKRDAISPVESDD